MAMAIIHNNVLNSHLDGDGNRVLDFPITKSECVDGLDERIKDISALNFKGIDCGTLSSIGVLEEEES